MIDTSADGRWEAGSEFDWRAEYVSTAGAQAWLPSSFELFATARDCLLALALLVPHSRSRPRLHLPSYFCYDVAESWSAAYDIQWYRDLPTWDNPDFESILADAGDVVLAFNSFGVRDGAMWSAWRRSHPNVVLVDDHSHDPFSIWARETNADFAVTSLRKTLPLPDGGMIWSPSGKQLPQPSTRRSPGATMKLEAMILKHAYLSGGSIEKDAFRSLQIEGENLLSESPPAAVSAFTETILASLDTTTMRHQRGDNIRNTMDYLREIDTGFWQPLFTTWPAGNTPLGVVLLCDNHDTREQLRQFLIDRRVYCPVHWQFSGKFDVPDRTLVADIADRILTLPSDHRYQAKDVIRIVDYLSIFASS